MNHTRHLTDDQIERYVQENSGHSRNAGQFEAHLAECELCRSRLLETERSRLGIQKPGMRHTGASADCPREDDLQAFAAGLRPAWILEHVAGCNHCAPLLREYLTAIEEDLETDSEPDPSRVTVREEGKSNQNWISKKIHSWLKRTGESYRLLPFFAKAFLAAALILVASVPVIPPALNAYRLTKAEKAITLASQEAAMKMRLSWGGHPQPAFLKDPTKPPSPVDSPLLALAAELASNNQNRADPRWIRLRGRVKLILGEYEDSAKLLTLATEMGLNDPDTEIDLAVADFQRDTQAAAGITALASPGDGDQNPVYLSESLELLTKVLKNPELTPNQRATATFDLAMVYQRMRLWDQAVLTWEKYLELDPAGAWHDDAWHRLEEARKKILPPKPQGYRTPEFFLNHFSDPEVLASLEDYQEIALREWLSHIDDPNHYEFSAALRKLAEVMDTRHGDPWIRDFLSAHRPGDGPALLALSEAVTRNRVGRYGEAERYAQEAAKLFSHFQNPAGQLRARFETVYANQRLLQQEGCLTPASVLQGDLARTHYEWLRTQIALEQAVCLNFMNRTKAAEEQLAAAGQNTVLSNFPFLNLRVRSLDANIHIYGLGNCGDSWQKAQAGLDQYWSGSSNPQRLYEFYSALKLCLAEWHLWNAAETLERRMITILEGEINPGDQNALLQVTAHRALEQILRELDEPEEAADEAKLALQFLAQVDPDVAVRYSVPIKLELADLQLDHDDAEAAWQTIQEADDALTALRKAEKDAQKGNILLRRMLLRIHGDVNLRRQMAPDAEVDYQEGIEIAEGALKESKTEEQRRELMRETGDLYRGLVEVYVSEKREKEALQLWSWYQGRSFNQGDGERWRGMPKWAEIQQEVLSQPLPSSQAPRLVYVCARDKLLIWSFGHSGFRPTTVQIKCAELQKKIQQYSRRIGREQRAELPLPAPDAESKELFALVLQPVWAGLTGSDGAAPVVTIDLDVAMNGLQAEALMSPDGWYLGQRCPIVYSPGYLRENRLRKYSQQVPTTAMAINALGDERAVARFKDLVPRAVIINDVEWAPADQGALLARSEMFLFVGHGKSGALLLGNNQPLKAEDFPQQSLANMQIAVLVACVSGVPREGEGLLDTGSLIHAFESGGTPEVIASNWNVAADSTEQFMDSFFSNMKKGDPPAQALFRARQEVFRVSPHPYYWAAFTLSGRP